MTSSGAHHGRVISTTAKPVASPTAPAIISWSLAWPKALRDGRSGFVASRTSTTSP